MGINLRGEWSCMKFELQQMRKQGSGAIVNCSSLGGLVGGAERGIYHAAKHGVLGFTKSAALEYAARGISTPKDIVQVRGTMNLYHYRPLAGEVYRVPILIVMATTNRGYILDLVPGQSFVEFMLKQGYDVYMLDWTPPRPEEKSLPLADYVLDFIPNCIQHIQRESGETEVSVVGYCFGGVLSLLYGSIFPDGPMKNLVCFTTPIDFHEMKLFANFSDRRYFDVDRLVDSVGTSLAFGQLLRVGDGA
jgi:poly(3-hydroxyalkanoate) synthetase